MKQQISDLNLTTRARECRVYAAARSPKLMKALLSRSVSAATNRVKQTTLPHYAPACTPPQYIQRNDRVSQLPTIAYRGFDIAGLESGRWSRQIADISSHPVFLPLAKTN